ncbi:hypothetical protein N7494_003555 [Penicillium frequentans]|uniref:T6SS Phospholipase effector Tle1-like catalytic domain-containing protein n=1 Tax=Penicillium frequentans TaxID=3151616 RepID=A0AAD6GFT4_9EURO|nr:hypothetical protein N7494_003555 [Penicillium glabrum]
MDLGNADYVPGEDYILRQRKDAQHAAIRKRIVICCDGTWQSATSGQRNVPSNVTRLCRALNHIGTDEKGDQWQQVVWYDSGVGTTAGVIGDVVEGAFGQGVEQNVIEAYNFCVLNYKPGDKIMCFGFSRGAYTARTIAGLISDIGICHKSDLNKFPDLWAMYKQVKHGKRFDRSDLWFDWRWGKADENQGAGTKDNRTFVYEQVPEGEWAQDGSKEVEVVGVFDTVGAIGMPQVLGMKLPSAGKNGWHNVGLSPNIKHAYHALALDEHRQAFSPSVWFLPNKKATPEDCEVKKKEEEAAKKKYWITLQEAKDLKAGGKATDKEVNDAARAVNEAARAWNKATRRRIKFENRVGVHSELKQVWFPGYHVNIGGGDIGTLQNIGDMEEMSSITFSWMLDQIKAHLSIDERFIIKEHNARARALQKINQEYLAESKKAGSFKTWIYHTARATASVIMHPLDSAIEPAYRKIRAYGWGTGELIDSFTSMYWLNGKKWRTPGEYGSKDGKDLGETFEFIHPVVNFRVEQMKEQNRKNGKHPLYMPLSPGTKYERRRVEDAEGNVRFEYYVGNSSKPVPEWRLGGMDSYERLAITGEAAYIYADKLDEELRTGCRTERCAFGNDDEKEFWLKPVIVQKADGLLTLATPEEAWGEQSQLTAVDGETQPTKSLSETTTSKSFGVETTKMVAPSQVSHTTSVY